MASRRNPGVKRILCAHACTIAPDALVGKRPRRWPTTRRLRCRPRRSKCVDSVPPRALTRAQDDLWTWHFTIRVPHPGFEGGIYHGRINVRVLMTFSSSALGAIVFLAYAAPAA